VTRSQVLNDSFRIGTFLRNFGSGLVLVRHATVCTGGSAAAGGELPSHQVSPRRNRFGMIHLCQTTVECCQDRRAKLGGTPVNRRKCRAKWLWSEKPAA
jgi:hypothetical protein